MGPDVQHTKHVHGVGCFEQHVWGTTITYICLLCKINKHITNIHMLLKNTVTYKNVTPTYICCLKIKQHINKIIGGRDRKRNREEVRERRRERKRGRRRRRRQGQREKGREQKTEEERKGERGRRVRLQRERERERERERKREKLRE